MNDHEDDRKVVPITARQALHLDQAVNRVAEKHWRRPGNARRVRIEAAKNGTRDEGSSAQFEAQGLLKALRVLESEQGIDFNLGSKMPNPPNATRSIADLCASAGLRHRKVLLTDRWWECDSGPMLAFQPSGKPVVLLQRGRTYHLCDPAADTATIVNGVVAAGLQSEAYIFYRPLPGLPLKLTDLLRFGIHGQMRDVAALIGATVCTGLLALLTPVITRRVVDSSIASSNKVELIQMVIALVVGAVAAALFEIVRGLTLQRLKSSSAVSLQAALWDRLLALPASFFRGFSVGDLVMRAMGINGLQHVLTSDVTNAIFGLLSALLSLTILFYYSWPLGLLALASAVAIALLTATIARWQLHHVRELHRLDGRLSALAYGLLSGIAKLRVAGAEKRAFALWAERFAEHRHQSVAVRRLSNMQAALGSLYGAATPIAFFAMVGLSSKLGLGVGSYLAFNAAFAQFQAAAMTAISVIPTFLGFVPTYERMCPILTTLPESRTSQLDPGILRGEIEMRHVSFGYGDGPQVLKDVSLHVKAGEFVAIVGPSGSGKSTCLRLMLGFEQPATGAILIDGQEAAKLNMGLVRRGIGVVLQSGGPLAGNIFHNIIGSLPLSLDDAWRAARLVGLEEDIQSMPMSMFTPVNQRGVSFSGGQRQRLLLARAIVNDPRILLLDEATSALDNRTQDLIARNLKELGATRIVIAHRLSTVRNADRIYVLDQGRVIEHGTFDDLISRGGVFARMTRRQMVHL